MHEILPHTADVRLRVEAPDLESLFREALAGIAEFVRPDRSAAAASRRVAIEAPDATWLLVDFLNEALLHLHVDRESLDRVEFASLAPTSLEATLSGMAAASWSRDVKAVTYHEAEVAFRDGRWSTTLVLDI